MSYDEKLANRVRKAVNRNKGITEKSMFGGISFLLNGKMFCGVLKNDLVVRVGPELYEKALNERSARPMDFTGRPMEGFVYVGSSGLKSEAALKKWIKTGMDYVSSLC